MLQRSPYNVSLFVLMLLFQHIHCYINATGVLDGKDPATGQWPMRQEINVLASQGKQMWDLYIQALLVFHNAPVDDPLSYYQIAGIHGFPSGPWDNVGGGGGRGFCMHSSVLFPLWHRPYLALYEQILSTHAHEIANQYPVESRSDYLDAAKALRIPYWDWAVSNGLPSVMTQEFLQINTASGTASLRNPLYQYQFPLDMSLAGRFPSYGGVELLPNLTHTVKHYNQDLRQSDLNGVSAEFAANSPAVLDSLYKLFTKSLTWTSFARYTNETGNDIEGLHGRIHNQLGGRSQIRNGETVASGHMTVTEFSAYDPSFWLHHANVDRVTAIWQVLYDDAYVEPTLNVDGTYYQPPNTFDTLQTPLAPFHAGVGDNMWTAATARKISTFGYTYPELLETGANHSSFKNAVREKINKLYSPDAKSPSNSSKHIITSRNTNIAQVMSNVHADTALRLGVNNLEVQWYLRIRADDQQLKHLAVFFFVGEEPLQTTNWPRARNLVGSYVPLFDSGSGSNQAPTFIDVPCTHTVAAAVDRGLLRNILPESAIPFIESHVRARMIGSEAMGTGETVRVSIVSQRIQPRQTFVEFPHYEESEEHGQLPDIEMAAL